MKKIIILMILALIIGSTNISASNIESSVHVEKGWNLITGFTGPSKITSNSAIVADDIKAVYLLFQPFQNYIRLYPNPETDKLNGIQDSYYEKTSQWVYSNKAGILNYDMEEPLPIKMMNEFQIYKGWNLIGLNSELTENPNNPDLSLEDIAGDCEILKAYYFFGQEWIKFDMVELDSTLLNKGLVINVMDDCIFGEKEDKIPAPPVIPN